MELPSARELELEILVRERDSQLAELKVSHFARITPAVGSFWFIQIVFLKDEIASLRLYLAKHPGPSTAPTEPISLPPSLVSVLLPHINTANGNAASVSATVTSGLNQRMKQLQEENEELYNLLKTSETGKLGDEVQSLRRVVFKLEGALKGIVF